MQYVYGYITDADALHVYVIADESFMINNNIPELTECRLYNRTTDSNIFHCNIIGRILVIRYTSDLEICITYITGG